MRILLTSFENKVCCLATLLRFTQSLCNLSTAVQYFGLSEWIIYSIFEFHILSMATTFHRTLTKCWNCWSTDTKTCDSFSNKSWYCGNKRQKTLNSTFGKTAQKNRKISHRTDIRQSDRKNQQWWGFRDRLPFGAGTICWDDTRWFRMDGKKLLDHNKGFGWGHITT